MEKWQYLILFYVGKPWSAGKIIHPSFEPPESLLRAQGCWNLSKQLLGDGRVNSGKVACLLQCTEIVILHNLFVFLLSVTFLRKTICVCLVKKKKHLLRLCFWWKWLTAHHWVPFSKLGCFLIMLINEATHIFQIFSQNSPNYCPTYFFNLWCIDF